MEQWTRVNSLILRTFPLYGPGLVIDHESRSPGICRLVRTENHVPIGIRDSVNAARLQSEPADNVDVKPLLRKIRALFMALSSSVINNGIQKRKGRQVLG